ncbi:hypothetical protein [Jannaschia aquimarina]|uniref:SseB protein N-terminal domain-containing protein n=1 Tax=Jannaschia aquimarina TaxID=935700 RepID=A0A0D1CKI1_9RHOB|nr:hypothetical protein [Jannaschia aquimarina]KIT15257.1 hypothetical protein jaqu_30800 [Jannaschia aquimarina]SNT32146.1 hypothetical protein SAMN05421775_11146 [Jannaschia aquimarina]
MTDPTPLDRAHLRAEESGSEDARRAFWERLAEAELSLLLAAETEGETADPAIVEVEGARFVLAFDLPARLVDFAGETAPTATLSGRGLARLCATQGLGIALNLEEHPSAQLVLPDAVAWLAEATSEAPVEAAERIAEIGPPGALPDAFLTAIDAKLPLMAGLAHGAYLARASYDGGTKGHILAFLDPIPGAEPDLARAIHEALTFSGLDAASLDVTFLSRSNSLSAALARHGLRIDLPEPPMRKPADGPPRLR